MTEDQIERRVEKMFDRADLLWLNGKITDAEYNAERQRITDWADAEYVKSMPRR